MTITLGLGFWIFFGALLVLAVIGGAWAVRPDLFRLFPHDESD